MTEVSLLGGGEATEQPKPPCLHRVEDGHLSGLPFICTLDKGHEGEHAEELTAEDIEGAGSLTLDQARALHESIWRAIWRAEEAPGEAFRQRMFGDRRPAHRWETVRLFTTSSSRRAHVVDQADISDRLDGVRVGDPFVTSACSMVWAFADDVSLEVDGMPVCEACARTLLKSPRLRDLPVAVGGKS